MVFEGPCGLPWENIEGEFRQRDWNVTVDEFLTMAVRRRKCLVASPDIRVDGALATTTSRSTLAPPIGATLGHTREMCKDVWVFPEQVVMDSGIPRNPLMPILKGHFWMHGERWELFGDSRRAVESFGDKGVDANSILVEGNQATGGRIAQALTLTAGSLVSKDGGRAGGGDPARQLRQGHRAGLVWFWGEAMWAPSSDDDSAGETRAGGRRARTSTSADVVRGEAAIQGIGEVKRPCDVGPRVDEWVEENLCGCLAPSTTKQYSGVYGKWKAWARWQIWDTSTRRRGLRYLGWLGATIKQAIFAVKDAHKRCGHGDPTEHMYGLWAAWCSGTPLSQEAATSRCDARDAEVDCCKYFQGEAGSGDRFDAAMLRSALWRRDAEHSQAARLWGARTATMSVVERLKCTKM